MSVRLELDRLRGEGIIAMDKSGVVLTKRGSKMFSQALGKIKQVKDLDLGAITQDAVSQAALLSCCAIKPAWRYRDLVISQGGSGFLMLKYGLQGWFFPDSKEILAEQNPRESKLIEDAFPTEEKGDILLVVSAADSHRCGLSLWRVAREILCEQ